MLCSCNASKSKTLHELQKRADMSIEQVIMQGIKDGLVKQWDKMTPDEREYLDGVSKGQCISVPCRLVCKHPISGEQVDYELIYKIDAYSATKRKAHGYAQNLTVPEYSEYGGVYIDSPVYIWQT